MYCEVRYVGEAVAAVAAEDVATPREALRLIKVEYEQLPAVFDPEAARPGAPVLHGYAPGNIVKHIPIRKGDVEAGLRRGRSDRRGELHTQQVEHAYLEPEAGHCLCRSRRRGHGDLAEPEHHPPPPYAGEDPRQADQQGPVHHEPGRRRLRRQGGHDLPGHAGAGRDEDAAAGAARLYARGVDHLHRQAASCAHRPTRWA